MCFWSNPVILALETLFLILAKFNGVTLVNNII